MIVTYSHKVLQDHKNFIFREGGREGVERKRERGREPNRLDLTTLR